MNRVVERESALEHELSSTGPGPERGSAEAQPWTFLSNHAHVLVCLDRSPNIRMREIAQLVGITERGVHRILSELEQAGVISKQREGRRNHYEINRQRPLRHPLEKHTSVEQLLAVLAAPHDR